MSSHNQRVRDGLFSLADARGNNPHGTREDSVHEGRRLNRKRYETVGQIDRAVEARVVGSRAVARRAAGVVGGGVGAVDARATSAPRTTGGASLLEAAFLVALGAGFVYLLTRKDEEKDDYEGEAGDSLTKLLTAEVLTDALLSNPEPVAPTQQQPHVVVVTAPPTPVVVPPPVEPAPEPKRRRKTR